VFAAYGWPDILTDAEILERLLALNHERAPTSKTNRKKSGHVRESLTTSVEIALANLPNNEPIEWLFGRVLNRMAAEGQHHFFFDLLSRQNPQALGWWNAWISEFRDLLRNPEIAVRKADDELTNQPPERIGDFMAEIFAVINLSRSNYKDFEVVLAGRGKSQATVDFMARRDGRPVRIEVKRLHIPEHIIRTVVEKRWRECRRSEPNRYNFGLTVIHHHHGALSDDAIARLNDAVNRLPDVASDEYSVMLDTDCEATLTRIRGTSQFLCLHFRAVLMLMT